MTRHLLQSYRTWLGTAAILVCAAVGQAQTFKTLYAFTGGLDGGAPWGNPTLYNGYIFGTTYYGGGPSSAQVGTVFQYFPLSSGEYPLYVFTGQPYDGAYPMGGLAPDGFGDFYGTTTQGGFNLKGTIYTISNGYEAVLYNFRGIDGESPEGNLLMDENGNLYGTTSGGGANESGTVFAYSVNGSLVQLYSFGNYKDDGIAPAANVVLNKGAVYGTTTEGGKYGWGTVFSVDLHTKAETILYDFQGKKQGGTPEGGLVLDGQGNLYGTASVGGTTRRNAGDGVIYKINIHSHQLSVVHKFSGADGSDPTGPLVADGQGNYFGTTFSGGANGFGTVFEFNNAGAFTSIYSFANGTDGANPYGGVTLDSSGNIYGTTTRGGQGGWGTLYEITPAP